MNEVSLFQIKMLDIKLAAITEQIKIVSTLNNGTMDSAQWAIFSIRINALTDKYAVTNNIREALQKEYTRLNGTRIEEL